jgi:hypothetical protein
MRFHVAEFELRPTIPVFAGFVSFVRIGADVVSQAAKKYVAKCGEKDWIRDSIDLNRLSFEIRCRD